MNSFKNQIFNLSAKLKKSFSGLLRHLKPRKKAAYSQEKLDKSLIYSMSRSKIPTLTQIKHFRKTLTSKEKMVVNIALVVIFANVIFLGAKFYKEHLQIVPANGGDYVEGMLGAPKNINPLYASVRDVDQDISSLLFSSLLKRNENGELVNDLAENYSVSDDGKTYTFTIRDNVKWHNGESLTVDDVIFTFEAIKNIDYKSSLRSTFLGASIERVDEKTLRFVLVESYPAFPELLTFGILPSNLWVHITPDAANLAELNLKPIGSGPYKFKSLVKDRSGNIREYRLAANEDYYGETPYVKNLVFKFFVSFEEMAAALNNNVIDGISYLPHKYKKDLIAQDSLQFHKLNLPQITAVFFNQDRNSYLENKIIRQALAYAIDKDRIVFDIFEGDAEGIDSPIAKDSFAYNSEVNKYEYNAEQAQKLLSDAGFEILEVSQTDLDAIETKKTATTTQEVELSEEEQLKETLGVGKWQIKRNKNKKDEILKIKLTTVQASDNEAVVNMIKALWESIGVKVELNIVPVNQIQSEVIKPRNFEALLYGQVIGWDPDLYAFWHSSQAADNGLNIANYSNKDVDRLLEDGRLSSDLEVRKEKYFKFQEILTNDIPAIFVYSPIYTYIQGKNIKGFNVKNISSPYDRFDNISNWFIKTKKKLVW